MSLDFFSDRQTRRYLDHPENGDSVERTKRQRTLASDLFSCFSPKHYPRIFLDARLRSKLSK